MFQQQAGGEAAALMIIADRRLTIITEDAKAQPKPGQTVIALAPRSAR